VGNVDRHPPLQPPGAQNVVDLALGVAIHRHQQMRTRQIAVQVEHATIGQRTTVKQAGKGFFEQYVAADIRRQRRKHPHGQVDFALFDLLQHAQAAVLNHHQRGVRRQLAQLHQQFGQHDSGAVIGHRHAKGALRVCRHKVDGLAKQGLDLAEHGLERRLEVLRQRTEHHLIALANQ